MGGAVGEDRNGRSETILGIYEKELLVKIGVVIRSRFWEYKRDRRDWGTASSHRDKIRLNRTEDIAQRGLQIQALKKENINLWCEGRNPLIYSPPIYCCGLLSSQNWAHRPLHLMGIVDLEPRLADC